MSHLYFAARLLRRGQMLAQASATQTGRRTGRAVQFSSFYAAGPSPVLRASSASGRIELYMRLRESGRMMARRDARMLQERKRMDQKAEVFAYRQVIPTEGRVSEGPVSYGRHRTGDQLSFDFADKVKTGNGFRDPAFSENKTQPLHRWVPWIAGFSAQFVQVCFQTFLKDRRLRRLTFTPRISASSFLEGGQRTE